MIVLFTANMPFFFFFFYSKDAFLMVKHWFDVFHTRNYNFVRKYEVLLHLIYIYVNTDEIGMP